MKHGYRDYCNISNYDKSEIADLELPITTVNFSGKRSRIKGAKEKYIVALYKYKNTIPLDRSFHIFREGKRNASSYE